MIQVKQDYKDQIESKELNGKYGVILACKLISIPKLCLAVSVAKIDEQWDARDLSLTSKNICSLSLMTVTIL